MRRKQRITNIIAPTQNVEQYQRPQDGSWLGWINLDRDVYYLLHDSRVRIVMIYLFFGDFVIVSWSHAPWFRYCRGLPGRKLTELLK